ncbi:retrovirus-related pol polyprotein from transposon TNT 1-94 [Tanacetum coccineum]
MDFRSTPCVFLGYSPSHHGYRCLDISIERLYIARHVCFNEAQFPIDIPKTTSPPPSKTSPSSSSSVSHLSPTSQTSFESSNVQPSPLRQAMKEEYDALMKNGTWSLVPRASNTNVVDGKLKRDKNGAITRYKARFVAKGFQQQPGINFHETFSLVVKSTTIRAILSLEVTNDWPLRQLDIHNAFLHGNLKERVYMKQHPGFIDPQVHIRN